jgi:hypothetical protein
VNRNTVAAIGPAETKPPNRSTSPNSPKSGAATTWSGTVGSTRPQPGTWNTSFSTIASTVAAPMLISTAPGTFRAVRTVISSNPTQNTTTGQPDRCPSVPIRTGTVVFAASGTLVTKPALTSPTSAM